jgi:hypothetical protein
MKLSYKVVAIFVVAAVLLSCNLLTPKPTATPMPSATPRPSATLASASTATAKPKNSPTKPAAKQPTPTQVSVLDTPEVPVLPVPSGKPVKVWQGIPVMPEAIAGSGDSNSYSYTIKTSLDAVQKYYETEMKKLGWSELGSGLGTTDEILLIFTKASDSAMITAISQADGVVSVMFVK